MNKLKELTVINILNNIDFNIITDKLHNQILLDIYEALRDTTCICNDKIFYHKTCKGCKKLKCILFQKYYGGGHSCIECVSSNNFEIVHVYIQGYVIYCHERYYGCVLGKDKNIKEKMNLTRKDLMKYLTELNIAC